MELSGLGAIPHMLLTLQNIICVEQQNWLMRMIIFPL